MQTNFVFDLIKYLVKAFSVLMILTQTTLPFSKDFAFWNEGDFATIQRPFFSVQTFTTTGDPYGSNDKLVKPWPTYNLNSYINSLEISDGAEFLAYKEKVIDPLFATSGGVEFLRNREISMDTLQLRSSYGIDMGAAYVFENILDKVKTLSNDSMKIHHAELLDNIDFVIEVKGSALKSSCEGKYIAAQSSWPLLLARASMPKLEFNQEALEKLYENLPESKRVIKIQEEKDFIEKTNKETAELKAEIDKIGLNEDNVDEFMAKSIEPFEIIRQKLHDYAGIKSHNATQQGLSDINISMLIRKKFGQTSLFQQCNVTSGFLFTLPSGEKRDIDNAMSINFGEPVATTSLVLNLDLQVRDDVSLGLMHFFNPGFVYSIDERVSLAGEPALLSKVIQRVCKEIGSRHCTRAYVVIRDAIKDSLDFKAVYSWLGQSMSKAWLSPENTQNAQFEAANLRNAASHVGGNSSINVTSAETESQWGQQTLELGLNYRFGSVEAMDNDRHNFGFTVQLPMSSSRSIPQQKFSINYSYKF